MSARTPRAPPPRHARSAPTSYNCYGMFIPVHRFTPAPSSAWPLQDVGTSTAGWTAAPQSGVTYSAAAGAFLFDGTANAYVQLAAVNSRSNALFDRQFSDFSYPYQPTFVMNVRIEAGASAIVPLLAFGGSSAGSTPPVGGSGGACSSTFTGQSELYVTTGANWGASGGADIAYKQCTSESQIPQLTVTGGTSGGGATGLAKSTWAQIALRFAGSYPTNSFTVLVNAVPVATVTPASVAGPLSLIISQTFWGAIGMSTLFGTTLTGAVSDLLVSNKARNTLPRVAFLQNISHQLPHTRKVSRWSRQSPSIDRPPAVPCTQPLTAAQLTNLWTGGALCGPVPAPVPYAWTVGAAGASCDTVCGAANSQICYPPAASATWSGWPQVGDGTVSSAAAQAGVGCRSAGSGTAQGASPHQRPCAAPRHRTGCATVCALRVAQVTRGSPPLVISLREALAPAQPRPRMRPPGACVRARRLAQRGRPRRPRPSRTLSPGRGSARRSAASLGR